MSRYGRLAVLLALPAALLLLPLLVESGGAPPRESETAPSLVPGWSRVVDGARFRAAVPAAREGSERREIARRGEGVLTVIVRDDRNRPVPDALVALEERAPVRSDEDGAARVRLQSSRPDARLAVEADGYRRSVRTLPASTPERLTVELAPGGTLTGVAQWADGAPAADATVLCWPQDDPPSENEVLRAREGGASGALWTVRTESDGAFRVAGLDPTARYALGACATGGATLARESDRRPGESGLVLRLEPLVAAALELVDEHGGPLRACEGMFDEAAVWDPDAPSLAPVFLPEDAPETAWIGGSELARFGRGGRDHYLMLYRVLGGPDTGRHGTFSIRVPGYAAVWTQVALEPLSPELRAHRLRLDSLAERWGALALELTDAEGWLSTRLGADAESIGSLRLTQTESLERYEVALPPSDAPRWTLDGIPAGRYRVQLALRDWYGVLPADGSPELVVAVDEDGGRARLSLAGRGAGEVVVAAADGSDYDGELLLLVEQDGPRRFVSFRSAPYVLGGLEEGPYDVRVARAGSRRLASAPATRLWLAEGTVSACLVHLP